ncbi:hypothetical protein [Labrenzia sp. PHM005]|uniref:hypothetical protein n=1 Tax=Labrenzia sp. PHM005 TaxID=2590016 RepID=UPI00114001F1|nr:hypothetical protein [Labrenzia sp. PHM005]QDG78134.1 hypothetical protein FJ695_20965 [Labrenzia sp. PHM005]
MKVKLNTDLSEGEVYSIGYFVAQWGFLENDIYEQTILSFDDVETLPSSVVKNAQFGNILKLWLKRVVEKQEEPKKSTLREQYNRISEMNEVRQSLVHSRWEWSRIAPDEITAVRVHKGTVKRKTFDSDSLYDLAASVGEIRYSVRYPGGIEDQADEMMQNGGHISRDAWHLITKKKNSDDADG